MFNGTLISNTYYTNSIGIIMKDMFDFFKHTVNGDRIHDTDKNITIRADKIEIGENVTWGNDIDIKVRGTFRIGDHSNVGDRFTANGENIELGEHFYYKPTDSRGEVTHDHWSDVRSPRGI